MKKHGLPILCLLLCLLLTACGDAGKEKPGEEPPPSQEDTATEEDSTLIIAIQDEVVGLDVQQIAWENMVHDLIYEPLVVYSEDLSEIYPAFAESFTATDKYLEFVLPEGAKFSNGDVLDAAAVKASTERFIAISEYASDIDPVSSIEVIDERTVRYNLSEPAPYAWANIASMYGGIVDVAVAEQIGEWEFNKRPVANGPYYVDEWVSGSHITLKRNEYFHTANPMLQNHDAAPFETIVVRFIPDAAERMKALDEREVDVVFNAPTSRKVLYESSAGYNVYTYQQPGICYLNLQTGKGPLADIRVRQALTHAVDRNAIKTALGGVVTPTYSLLAASQAGYSEEENQKLAQDLAYDPSLSRQLLDEAGWKDPDGDGVRNKNGEKLHLELLIPSDNSSFRAAGPILQEQFAEIGVEAEIIEYEADYIKELMREDDFTIGSRFLKWVDPDILIYAFSEEYSGYPWDDPELTRLILAARYVTDPAERVEAYVAVSEQLAQDYKAISLFSDNYIIVTRYDVHGLVVTNDGRVWFSDTTKD